MNAVAIAYHHQRMELVHFCRVFKSSDNHTRRRLGSSAEIVNPLVCSLHLNISLSSFPSHID
ncbi:hypothetical protein AHF37_09652 [Paragonimus kellicotti]|nr:hypothetical protein AHF37_09652 [Paragonimus kellicotti]